MIYFIGGMGKENTLVAVAIGASDDPELEVERLRQASPFRVRLLAVEDAPAERLEVLKKQFKATKVYGPWYRNSNAIMAYLDALPPLPVTKKTTRISLDMSAQEFQQIEAAMGTLGVKTKAKLIRQAIRFFLRVVDLKHQGYVIQAIKNGALYQFNDLDHDPIKPGSTPK